MNLNNDREQYSTIAGLFGPLYHENPADPHDRTPMIVQCDPTHWPLKFIVDMCAFDGKSHELVNDEAFFREQTSTQRTSGPVRFKPVLVETEVKVGKEEEFLMKHACIPALPGDFILWLCFNYVVGARMPIYCVGKKWKNDSYMLVGNDNRGHRILRAEVVESWEPGTIMLGIEVPTARFGE